MLNSEHFLFWFLFFFFTGLIPIVEDLMFEVCMVLLAILTSCMNGGIYFQSSLVC